MRSKAVPVNRAQPALLMKKKSTKVAVPERGGAKVRKHKFKPGTVAMRDIRKAQKFGNAGIPKTVIDKIVREIAASMSTTVDRFTPRALRSLHDAAEAFNTDLFRWASTISLSCKRKTLDVGSLKLASTLLLEPHVMHERDGSHRSMQGVVRKRKAAPTVENAIPATTGTAAPAKVAPAKETPAKETPAAEGKKSASDKQSVADAAADDVPDDVDDAPEAETNGAEDGEAGDGFMSSED